jgi:group I intron endonuclease
MAQTIAGIYMIQSLMNPERVYIGSAVNLAARERHHFGQLKRGNHKSVKLQRHYNKYGKDDLIFEIIESDDYLDKNHLLSREQGWYIPFEYEKTELPYFNSSKIAGSQQGFRHSIETKLILAEQSGKRIQKEESKQKLIGNKNALGKRTPETIENIRKSKIGKYPAQETRDKMSKSHIGMKDTLHTRKKKSLVMMGNQRALGKLPWNKGLKKKEGIVGKITKNNIN